MLCSTHGLLARLGRSTDVVSGKDVERVNPARGRYVRRQIHDYYRYLSEETQTTTLHITVELHTWYKYLFGIFGVLPLADSPLQEAKKLMILQRDRVYATNGLPNRLDIYRT